MSYIGFGWEPRCPHCGASVTKPAEQEGKAGVYPCGTCGAVHARDERGQLVEPQAKEGWRCGLTIHGGWPRSTIRAPCRGLNDDRAWRWNAWCDGKSRSVSVFPRGDEDRSATVADMERGAGIVMVR